MLKRHGPTVEADFERYYNRDLADLYSGKMTVRKAAVLLKGLPRGAGTWVREGGPGAITAEVESLWLLENTLVLTVWDGKGKTPKPRDYPTTWEEAEQKENYAVSQAERWRAREKARAQE